MTRVLLVDDDPTFRSEMERVIRELGLEVFQASDPSQMRKVLQENGGPWIVVLDWRLSKQGQQTLTEVVRQTTTSKHAYVLATGCHLSRADVARAIRHGADECLHKPIAPDLFKSRLKAALRLVVPNEEPSTRVLRGLREGIEHGSGELVVRHEDDVFRVLIADHKVAFVSGPGEHASLPGALRAHGLDNEELEAAMQEAKDTGQGFFEILLSWGLAGEEELRNVTRDWIKRRMAALVATQSSQVLFVPKHFRKSKDTFSFELDELLPPGCNVKTQVEALRPPAGTSIIPLSTPLGAWENSMWQVADPDPSIAELIDEALKIPGARSAAVIQQRSGRCEGWSGQPLQPEVVWPTLQILGSLERTDDAPEELLFSTHNAFHIVRVLPGHPDRACYLVVDRSEGSLGLCRSTFARIVDAQRSEPISTPGITQEELKSLINE